MPSKNSEAKARENFMLDGKLSELVWTPKTEVEMSKQLFHGSNPEDMMDRFEAMQGITTKKDSVSKINNRYKCVFLRPNNDEDRALQEQFYNNPERYQVVNRSDNWTHSGDLVIFLEYFENMDVRAEQEANKVSDTQT
jgi:hypothetical protein